MARYCRQVTLKSVLFSCDLNVLNIHCVVGDFNTKSNTSIYCNVLNKFDTEDNTINACEALSNKK